MNIDILLVKLCESLFPSRLNRTQYGARWVFCLTVLYFTDKFEKMVPHQAFDLANLMLHIFLKLLIIILTIYALLILPVKRLHDMNSRGWWLIILFISAVFNMRLVLTIFLFILLLWRGNSGKNRFGLPPKTSKIESVSLKVMLLIVIAMIVWGAYEDTFGIEVAGSVERLLS